jgi:hypothetical protein
MRRWRLALCAFLLLWGLQTATTVASPTKAAKPPVVRSALIARSPIGLSIEYPVLERALGSGACPSPAMIGLLRELGSPSLRVGGDSQDLAGVSGSVGASGAAGTSGAAGANGSAGSGGPFRYVIPPSFWTALGCLVRETGIQVTVGLNFGEATVAEDQATIAAAEQAIPASQLSFSLGNEPDLYTISHVLPNEPEFTVPAFRAPTWSVTDYVSEWKIRRAELGAIRLEGPDLAGSGWKQQIGAMLREDPPDQIDAHVYPTTACGPDPTATAQRLLSEHSSVGLVEKLAWLVQTAQAAQRPAIISESNSASCAGKPGLSNTPVAGVWAARFVLGTLLSGFQQVRFHSAGTSYDPFVYNPDGTITREPLGNALFFLHRWLPLGSRIASSSTNHSPLFSVSVVDGSARSVIVTSFSAHAVTLPIAIEGPRTHVSTDALTTASPEDVHGSLPVADHKVHLRLAPNTVVALRTN